MYSSAQSGSRSHKQAREGPEMRDGSSSDVRLPTESAPPVKNAWRSGFLKQRCCPDNEGIATAAQPPSTSNNTCAHVTLPPAPPPRQHESTAG
jgi:hypothetical protein